MRPLLILIAVPLLTWGCVTTQDMDRLHKEINDLHGEVIKLEQQTPSRQNMDDAIARMRAEIQTLLKSNADVGVSINDLSNTIESLQTQLTDSNRRFAELSQKLALTEKRISNLTPGSAPPTEGESGGATQTPGSDVIVPPGNLYQQAYKDYLQGNYQLALGGFQDYLKQYPDTQTSDDALFYVGETYYAMKQFKDAVKAYDKLLVSFPSSELAPAARLKKGFSLFELGDKPQGVVEMQYVIYEYPSSQEANKAKEKLKELGIPIH